MPKTPEEIKAMALKMRAGGFPEDKVRQYVQLSLDELRASEASAPVAQAAPAQAVAPMPGNQEPDMWAAPKSVRDLIPSADVVKGQLNTLFNPMAGMAPDALTQGLTTATGARAGALIPGPAKAIAIPLGAAFGSVAGYLTNQYRKNEKPTAGGAAGSAVGGFAGGLIPSTAQPLNSAIQKFAPSRVAGIAGANAGANVAAGNAESMVDGRGPLSPADAAVAAGFGVAGTYAGSLMDKGQAGKSMRAKMREDSPNEAFRQKIIAEGGAFSPSFESPSTVNTAVGQLSKASALNVEFMRKNADWRKAKIKDFMGLSAGDNLGLMDDQGKFVHFDEYRQKQGEVYKAIDDIAQEAKKQKDDLKTSYLAREATHGSHFGASDAEIKREADLTRKASIETRVLKQLQEQEKDAWAQYRKPDLQTTQKDRDALRDRAISLGEQQDKVLETMDDVFKKMKLPLLDREGVDASQIFREARKNISMSHVIESAVDVRGNVDGKIIYDRWTAKKNLTGPLLDIARFYEMAEPVNQLPSRDHAETRSALGIAGLIGGGALGGSGAAALAVQGGMSSPVAGVIGAAGAIATAGGGIQAAALLRQAAASKFYQQNMTTPTYGSNIPDYLAYTARAGISAQGLEALRKYEAKKFDENRPSPLLRR
jgi:hypothetical protein